MAAWLGEFQCMGFDSSVCELMKETSSFCIYMVIESGSTQLGLSQLVLGDRKSVV